MNENIEFVLDKESEEYYSLKGDYSLSNHKSVHEDILGSCKDAIETFNRLVPIWEKINVVFVKRLQGNVLGRYRQGTSSSVPIIILCEKEILGASDEYGLPISTCVETTIYHELGHAICEMESDEFSGQYLVYKDEEDWVEGLAHDIYDRGTIPEDLKALIEKLLKEEPMRERIRTLLESGLRYIKGGLHPDYEEESDKNDAPVLKAVESPREEPKPSRGRGAVTEDDVSKFVSRCQEFVDYDLAKHYPNMPENSKTKLDFKMGRSYAKIIARAYLGSAGSAWAFVDLKTGDILKAASWNAPAKHARGNIFDEYEGMKYIGPYGPAYLR